jgi:transposase
MDTVTLTTYAGCNQYHLTDLLAEREGIRISRSTVRRILEDAGISSPRKDARLLRAWR